MNQLLVWGVLTIAFWFVVNGTINFVEAYLHSYSRRLLAMFVSGVVIGALASSVGYEFGILALLQFIQLWLVRRKVKIGVIKSDGRLGSNISYEKYVVPALVLIITSTIFSYVFAIEECDQNGNNCKRMFMGRLYTPPQLVKPQ